MSGEGRFFSLHRRDMPVLDTTEFDFSAEHALGPKR